MNVAALIACAGKSARMGTPKALLTLNGKSFVRHIVDTLREVDVESVLVSLPECEQTSSAIRRHCHRNDLNLLFFQNRYPHRELLGSVQTALSLHQPSVLLIIPVDVPFACVSLVRDLVSQGTSIAIAAHRGAPAHPISIKHNLFNEILSLSDHDSLHTVIANHASKVTYVESDDPRILLNINSPADYARLTKPSLKYFDAAPTEAPGMKSE